MILLERSSTLWAGLLISGALLVWGEKGENGSPGNSSDKPVVLSLASLNAAPRTLAQRKSCDEFLGMKSLSTDFVESANLGKDKMAGKVSKKAKKKDLEE